MQLSVIDANNNPQVINVLASTSNFSDLSGAIATANQAQQLAPANPSRSGWYVYNPGTTPLYVSDNGNAATNSITANNGSFVINAGQSLSSTQLGYCSTLALSIFATTTEGFIARVW